MKLLKLSTLWFLPLAVLLAGGSAIPARGQAVSYSSKPRVVNVGKLIVASGVYGGALAGVPEDTAPYMFYLLDLRTDLKPRGWQLQNPLAPTVVTQAIRDRWIQNAGNAKGIDPTPAHATPYNLGAPVTKNMAAYWEVDLLNTPLNDLLKYDLLFISSHTTGEAFTPQEQEKLRKLVEAGGVVWIDDCWKLRIADSGRFFLPNLQFHGSLIGKANPPNTGIVVDPSHPLLTTPYALTQDEVNHLGDKNVGDYYHAGFVPPQVNWTPTAAVNPGPPEPDTLAPIVNNSGTTGLPGGPYPYISAGRYGAGFVIITSGDTGDAINANCQGTTGYQVPNPNFDKNGGAICGEAIYSSDVEDLKFSYNVLTWASNFGTYRRGPQHAGYAVQSTTMPLSRQWQFQLTAGESIETDPILLRGKVFATTNKGRLLALIQDPSTVGSAFPQLLYQAQLPGPASSIATATVSLAGGSTELLLVSSGDFVYAFDQAGPGGAGPWNPVWTSPDLGGTVTGAPVYMDGAVYVTATNTGTAEADVWEIDPRTGQTGARVNAVMPPDPNNPNDTLPPAEPALHFTSGPGGRWSTMAAPPAVGYVRDRATSDDDPTLALCVYTTATQAAGGNTPAHGYLLQFPVKIANEHYSVDESTQVFSDANNNPQEFGFQLNYNAIKNPEFDPADVKNGGSGTMRIAIMWPGSQTPQPSYYALNGGKMVQDFKQGQVLPDGTWAFVAPTQVGLAARPFYNTIVLATNQLGPDGKTMTALSQDTVIHIDYDVDEGNPGAAGGHPEMGVLDLPPANAAAGSATYAAPAIGLDDSVYFGTENGIFYSASYFGTKTPLNNIATNWKYYLNDIQWIDHAGNPGNPVLLADSTNVYVPSIHSADTSQWVIRSVPTVGNGRVFVSATNLAVTPAVSRLFSFDTYEFQAVTAATAAGRGTQAKAGVPVVLHLQANALRSLTNPVNEIAQYSPVTGRIVEFHLEAGDYSVDPDNNTITLNNFGAMFANLPIYVWYNMADGSKHALRSVPRTPPDEVHNVWPGINGFPYDPAQKYQFPVPTAPYFFNTTTYASGGSHPAYEFPAENISNLIWQFPDPVWSPGVTWQATAGISAATALGEGSPVLVGDSLFMGMGTLITPISGGGNLTTHGLIVLPADSRTGLQGYTDPDGVGIYTFNTTSTDVTPDVLVNNNGNVIGAAETQQGNLAGALLAPYPPFVSFYDKDDFTSATYQASAMLSTPAITAAGAVMGSSTNAALNPPAGSPPGGLLTMFYSPTTYALDSYRLVALDAGGNISFEVPSTTKTTILGADEPADDENAAAVNPEFFHTSQVSFNRPSSMQKVNSSTLLIADTGNDRVVETDLGGNVSAEVTRYYDPGAPYQPGDFYTVVQGTPPQMSLGNVKLNNPTDAYEWSYPGPGGNYLVTDRLIVDAGNFQIVVLEDRVNAFGGGFVPYNGPGPTKDSFGNPVVWYHIKVWGTPVSPTGRQYRYRNAFPVLNNNLALTAVVATVNNAALNPQGVERDGASILVFRGIAPTNPGAPGTLQAWASSFADLRQDANKVGLPHFLQSPSFLRPYQFGGGVHFLYIDQGAPYTPTVNAGAGSPVISVVDSRVGNWGVYDLLPLVNGNPAPPDTLSGDFSANLSVSGEMDSLDYTAITLPNDPYYASVPSFQPTSAQYLPLTNEVLISNGAANPLLDPTTATQLGPGGEVLVLTGASFFHGAVPLVPAQPTQAQASPSYAPDNSPTPSIKFRSIPVKGSYILQQVVAVAR